MNNTNRTRMTAIVVGVLYVIGTVSGGLSAATTASILEQPDTFLEVSNQIASNKNQLILGALLVLTMGLSLAMVPIMMFPILKQHNERLAMGYVVFRGALETFTYMAIVISWLLLIPVSREFASAGSLDESSFEAVGTVMLEAGNWIGSLTTIVFILGALMFYYLLYVMRLIPRWISGWGIVTAIPYIAAGMLSLFGTIEVASDTYLLMVIPLAAQEMVMALWFIFRGFNLSAITAASE